MLYRWYAPQLGRYLKIDPLINHSLKPYSYVDSRPASQIDPLGLVAWTCGNAEVSVGAGIAGGLFYAECESACVDHRKVSGSYLIGAGGLGLGLTFPVEIGTWDLEDGEKTPDAGNLEGGFTIAGCSATPLLGISYTTVAQGKGKGQWSLGITGGLSINCFALTGGSLLISRRKKIAA